MKVKSQLIDAQIEQRSSSPTIKSEILYHTSNDWVETHDGANVKHLIGDTDEQSATISNNQSVAADVSGMLVDKTKFSRAIIHVAGRIRTDSAEYDGEGVLHLRHALDADSWSVDYNLWGDRLSNKWLGLVFTVTSAGQVQYTSENVAGSNYAGVLKFDIIKKFSVFSS